MTAVKGSDVDRVLGRPLPADISLLLFYGPDAGLVTERARAAAERAVQEPSDPFQLVRLEGDLVAEDPARLADEAGTWGLFGGRRVVWVKPTSRNLTPAVEVLLSGGSTAGTTVVLEAGELSRTAPLRALCERSPRALALPCYADDERGVAAVVDHAFRQAGLRPTREARATLIAALGGDRLATRGEIAKLLLYAQGQTEVTLADVDAVVSDVSGLAGDAILDAVFTGNRARADAAYSRARAAGLAASAILGQALRHALALLSAREDMAASGRSPAAAVEAWRGLHFSRRASITRQLTDWTSTGLSGVVEKLQGDILASRKAGPHLTDAIASAALLRIASAPQHQRRRSESVS